MSAANRVASDGYVKLVPSRSLSDPATLHVRIFHGGHPNICDSCSLQADCHELFGDRGERCAALPVGDRWSRIEPSSLGTLKALILPYNATSSTGSK